ncbi:DUF2868 domain-containing protein [Pseudomaricurvus sp.]|uniref:DUF2868 domain-containing protein n=1 Tax=Pseudomaricurvus sp. TaxID=2004510 RepID=UPI003F6CF80D
MASTPSSKAILKFFFKNGASSALFSWLNFRLYVGRKKLKLEASESSASAKNAQERKPASTPDYLDQWEQQSTDHKVLTTPARWFFPVLSMAVILVGFGAMAGVLNYTVHRPVNIWVPLALFAFIPFALTVISAYLSLTTSPNQIEHGHPWLILLVNKLQLRQFLPYKSVLLPWLLWKTQMFALLFSVSGLLSFFILATFQDYQFGWSSTLISDNATMVNIMKAVSWPWHWYFETPSEELINISRFSADNLPSSSLGESWWLTLVMAIVCYGILPRGLLALLLRQRFVSTLKRNIINSGDVEQFVAAQHYQTSVNPLDFEGEMEAPEEIHVQQADADIITWQQPDIHHGIVKNLGSSSSTEDDEWLNSEACTRDKPVLVLVDPLQIPTGELADCIELIQQHNSSVTLVLFSKDEALEKNNEPRYVQQLKSWQYFSQRHQIPMKRGR